MRRDTRKPDRRLVNEKRPPAKVVGGDPSWCFGDFRGSQTPFRASCPVDLFGTELLAAVRFVAPPCSVLVGLLAVAALADPFRCEVATGAEGAGSGGGGFTAEVVALMVGAGTDEDSSGEVHLGLLPSLPLPRRDLRLGSLWSLLVEEDDLRGVDLGPPALLARLLVVPLRDAQRAFDQNVRAFLQVLRGILTVAVPDDDVDPVRSLLLLTRTVLPTVGDGYGEFSSGSCSGSLGFGVFAEVAGQDDAVQIVQDGHSFRS